MNYWEMQEGWDAGGNCLYCGEAGRCHCYHPPKKAGRRKAQFQMFAAGEELPLFSGTAPRAVVEEFNPPPTGLQARLPGMPAVSFEELAPIRERLVKPRRK